MAIPTYYMINCEPFSDISIRLSEKGKQHPAAYSILGLASEEPISAAMKAIGRSPFKTAFVIDEVTGNPIFAITQNEEYIAYAKKRNPDPDPPPPPASDCCNRCARNGGTGCFTYPDGSCFCVTDENADDALGTVPPPGI